MGRDSSVGIATRYGLGGPGIESWWGTRFSAPFQTGPGAHPTSCRMGTGSFPGVKRPGRGVDHQPPYSAEVEGRVELYLHSPPWAFVACWRTLPLLCIQGTKGSGFRAGRDARKNLRFFSFPGLNHRRQPAPNRTECTTNESNFLSNIVYKRPPPPKQNFWKVPKSYDKRLKKMTVIVL